MKPITLAVVGGQRGESFISALQALRGRVELVAVCDIDETVLSRWQQAHPDIAVFTEYDQMLEESDCKAVIIATPVQLHAKQAIKAMRRGVDVFSEVTAAQTLEDCWELVETVESTGRTYMLAENYCYMRENMAVWRMVQEGIFGEVYYAEGAYIHDCSDLMLLPNGELTWRGQILHGKRGNWYPTHSLGPVAQWLGTTGKNAPDRLATMATYVCGRGALEIYAERNFPAGHPARNHRFNMESSATTIVTTEHGKVGVLRFDVSSHRPHNPTHYALQGLRGAYLALRYYGEDSLIWIEDCSPAGETGVATEWESFSKYIKQYEHPLWQQGAKAAEEAGHGGGDYFTLREFITAIEEQRPPMIDVYDAVTWSAITPLSEQSLSMGGAPIAIPSFRKR